MYKILKYVLYDSSTNLYLTLTYTDKYYVAWINEDIVKDEGISFSEDDVNTLLNILPNHPTNKDSIYTSVIMYKQIIDMLLAADMNNIWLVAIDSNDEYVDFLNCTAFGRSL